MRLTSLNIYALLNNFCAEVVRVAISTPRTNITCLINAGDETLVISYIDENYIKQKQTITWTELDLYLGINHSKRIIVNCNYKSEHGGKFDNIFIDAI